MPMPGQDDLDDPLMSTAEIIEETRRPLLIARHQEQIEEMESAVAEAFVTGDSDNPRVQSMLKELSAASEQTRIESTIESLANDEHYTNVDLRQAVIEHLCLLRENHGIEIAALQMHVIGVYRRIYQYMQEQQHLVPTLDDLRCLPTDKIGILLHPIQATFGTPGMAEALVYSPTQAKEALSAIKRLRRPPKADTLWKEAAGEPPLSRDEEEPLETLSESQRKVARQRMISDRIRSTFYRDVFLKYFDRDTLDMKEVQAHRTILHWLESILETPHMYPFMQGQTSPQKQWRLMNLCEKIVQINEFYQRVAIAENHPSYRDAFAGKKTRECLALLAKDRYPALEMTSDFVVSTMLCPFEAFARWVQDRVADKDFVLPPEPKRRV